MDLSELDSLPPIPAPVNNADQVRSALAWIRNELDSADGKMRVHNYACVIAILSSTPLYEKYVPDPEVREAYSAALSRAMNSMNDVLRAEQAALNSGPNRTPYGRVFSALRSL